MALLVKPDATACRPTQPTASVGWGQGIVAALVRAPPNDLVTLARGSATTPSATAVSERAASFKAAVPHASRRILVRSRSALSSAGAWAAADNAEIVYAPANASWLNRIEAQFTALRYFALDSTDHSSHEEKGSMIRRYIIWRDNHAYDE